MRGLLRVVGLVLALTASASAAVVIGLSHRELAARADCVVRGQVIAAASRRETRGDVVMVVTDYTLRVDERLAGACPSVVVVTEIGGRVDGTRQVAVGAPAYRVGVRVVAFLRGDGGRYTTVGLSQGLFFEHRPPGVDEPVLVRELGELGGTTLAGAGTDGVIRPRPGETAQPEAPLRLADVRSLIAAARADHQ